MAIPTVEEGRRTRTPATETKKLPQAISKVKVVEVAVVIIVVVVVPQTSLAP